MLVWSQFGSGSSPGNAFGFRFSPTLVRSSPGPVQSCSVQFSSVPFWFCSVSVQFSPITFQFGSVVQFSSVLFHFGSVPFHFSSVLFRFGSVQLFSSVPFWLSSVQSSSIQFGIYEFRKAHMPSTPSQTSFNTAFETVPKFT